MNEEKFCETCGQRFFVWPSKTRQRFCSKSCVRRILVPDNRLQNPYRQTKRDGKRIDVHRAIMEEFLGRKLGRFELVHHKDGNKLNNDLSNLSIMTPQQHSSHHNQKHPVTWNCEWCGKEFTPPKTKRGGRRKTCSKECCFARTSAMYKGRRFGKAAQSH